MPGPLDITLDLSNAKTSAPAIADGYLAKFRFAKAEQDKNDNGDILIFEYHLLDPAPDTEGGTINPGFKHWERFYLYDKNTPKGQIPKQVSDRIASRMDAFLGTGDRGNKKGKPERDPSFSTNVANCIGKEAFLKMKAKTDDYGGNDIAKSIFPGDLTA